jgi:hypothetical protein
MQLKRWFWLLASLLISTGVYFTIRYGLRPKAIPVMNATEFAEAPQIGAVIYKRLRQEVRTEHVILLGSTPEFDGYADVWTGLLKTAAADQVQVTTLFQREGLKAPELNGLEIIPFNEGMIHSGDFLKLVRQRVQAGKLVVIHAATNEISHLFADSLSHTLDKELEYPVLAISTLALSLKPEEISALQTRCLDTVNPSNLRLECAEARVSKVLAKKPSGDGKLWAVMERHGLKEYLVFVHR